MQIYEFQEFGDWLQQQPNRNGMPLEYSEEKVGKINLELQFPALLSKERIAYLEKEKEYFLVKINGLKWNEKKLEILNNCKKLWQTQS
ncbi:protein of unknown function [endosymbiont DhMRE of Dentiscutata heterogama]|uniref:hypothetical protein n=1 Tax=endosymbiont DhMRE of Dentiscutata heterogama TaxID=1609546 RepID=UPI000629D7B7|nr:hypothetical protein [endosymbiont DhMRE of Dentiscutata heterogama]CFW93424.1 protein of unknown function [endosymbiont DhMRE of Dentiscutata heterogama]